MIGGFPIIFATPLISFAFAAAGVPLARRLALRYGALAPPAPDSHHREPTPQLGGLAIIGATLLSLAAVGELRWSMALGAVCLLAVGMIDDAIVLSPRQKFAAEVAVISGVLAMMPGFRLTPWPLADALIALFWLLAATNSYNLIDGLDGLASGIGIVAAAAIAATALLHNDAALAGWAFALAGALLGFLIYNFRPASIFMGDGGALPVGLLLGIMALRSGALAGNSRLTVYVFPVLVMLVPLLDTAIVSVTRLATGRGISRRGLDHSHHRLLSLGLTDQGVVMVCWGAAALASAMALVASLEPHAYLLATLPLMVLAAALVGLFMMDLTFDARAPGATYGYLPRLARFILSAGYKWRLADVALDAVLISAAYCGAFLIRLDFTMSDPVVSAMIGSIPWVLLAAYPAFAAVGVYRGIWRYTGVSNVIRFADGSALAGIFLVALSFVSPVNVSGSIVVLFVILVFNLLVLSRMSFQLLRKGIRHFAATDERVLIVGVGQLGASAAHDVVSDRAGRRRLVGFVDDDGFKQGKLVDGHPVLGSLDDLEKIYGATGFNQMLIADPLDDRGLTRVWTFANEHNVDVHRFSIEVNEIAAAAMNGSARDAAPIALGQTRRARF